jgi:hypothetical protein
MNVLQFISARLYVTIPWSFNHLRDDAMLEGTRLTGVCGHRNRSDQGIDDYCQNPAGFRTDHPGVGFCFHHGGASMGNGTSVTTHGRYSKLFNTEIGQLIEKHNKDEDPLNLLQDLAAARALFEDFVYRYEQHRAELTAWFEAYTGYKLTPERIEALDYIIKYYESLSRRQERSDVTQAQYELVREFVDKALGMLDKPLRPYHILDISDASNQLEKIGKMVERIEKIRAQNAISRKDLIRVITEMGRVVNVLVPDEETKQRIHREWLSIKLT